MIRQPYFDEIKGRIEQRDDEQEGKEQEQCTEKYKHFFAVML